MQNDIVNLRNQAIARVGEAGSLKDLEEIRIEYLGRKGILTGLFKEVASLPPQERAKAGALINETKKTIQTLIGQARQEIKSDTSEKIDLTMPGVHQSRGHLHLVTQAIEEIVDIFKGMGFVRMRYPEVEWDWFSFESLGFTENSPARDEWETFFVDQKPHPKYGPMVLTPHTSSGQVREMQRVKSTPPVRMINISKTYRRQQTSKHYPMFHQFEGMVIDEHISVAHLKGTLDRFATEFFGKDSKTRIRPYTFPFTEPSFEVDISCTVCGGTGKSKDGNCTVCKAGWLEIGGSGMIHPAVLKNGGIDPKKYSGFAFGWGVERVMWMKPGLGIPDLRLMYSTDLRYLTQF